MKKAFLFFTLALSLFAVEVTLQIDGIVDNREYMGDYDSPGTIFGLREAGTVTLGKDTTHTFNAGITWFQEFGSPIEDWKAAPLLYYRYKSERARLLFGSFMRDGNIFYSPVFQDERYSYKRPQVEGFDYRYSFSRGFQSIWIDWDSRQTYDSFERFFVGISGQLDFGKIFIDHHFLYHHLAGRDRPHKDPVTENGGGHLVVRYEENNISVLDTLRATAELIGSYNRSDRNESWNAPLGTELSATVVFHRLGMKGRFYKGIVKSKAWHQLEQGQPFYNAPHFAEIAFLFYPYKNEYIDMKFNWVTTFVGGDVEHRQYFLLTGTFGHRFAKGNRDD